MLKVSAVVILAVAFSAATAPSPAGVILSEGWETPPLAPGTASSALPAPWQAFSGRAQDRQIWHPNDDAAFDADPLAAPAGGNQLLYLQGVNTGVYRMSGALIEAGAVYTLSAAIGNANGDGDPNNSWSLQLWADSDGDGAFGGGGDTFIGQEYGTNLLGAPENPAGGGWALNEFVFDASVRPDLTGQQLIVFLNNYLSGRSYYDNVTLQAASAAPEPSTLALFGLGGMLGGVRLLRRRRRNAV